MKKPNLKNIGVNVGAAGITAIQPIVIGADKIGSTTKRMGRRISDDFTEAKVLMGEISEERLAKKAAKAQAEATEVVAP